MKIVLYIVLGLIGLVTLFFVWFFAFFLKVPELKISENATKTERFEQIDHWLTELHTNNKFNGGILFTKDGEVQFAKTYGYTNATKADRLTNDSSFRLASVSKQFTAAGIMLLNEQGKLTYDDLVSKYIVNFPYQNVTIRHLLNHTSGVPDSYMDLAEQFKTEFDVLTNEKAVELIVTHNPVAEYGVNDVYSYSNTNYILLARIIELVSGQSFETFMQENLFNPLDMDNTRVWNLLSKEETFTNKTEGFEDFTGKARAVKPSFIDGVAGDGAVFSSLNDFVIWDKFWTENPLIQTAHMKEAFKTTVLNNGEKSNYGFGWVMLSDDIMMHNGAWLAAKTYFVRNIKNKTAFVVLDNSSNVFLDEIIEQINKN